MIAVGISDLRHDPAVAAVDATGVLAAIEEEKLGRAAPRGGVPRLALAYCVAASGGCLSDVPVVGMATRLRRAWLRDERLRATLLREFVLAPWRLRAPYGLGSLARVAAMLTEQHEIHQAFSPKTTFIGFEHHLCHAASAYFASEFDRALILTLDERGDLWSGLLSVGEGSAIRILRPMRVPDSLGWVYTRTTELLGFQPHGEEPKMQWLSQLGEPDFIDVFRGMFRPDADTLPRIDRILLGDRLAGESGFNQEFCRRARITPKMLGEDDVRRGVARSVQDFLEETVVRIAEHFRQRTGTTDLCLAGGVCLNVLLIRAIEERTGFRNVFVQAVAGNAGTALGAAYLAYRHYDPAANRTAMRHLYLGPDSPAAQVKPVLDNCKIVYSYLPVLDRLLGDTVRLLHQHKVVAWHQGRTEFGHRALGNRAILVSPFAPYVIENLNRYIKHREGFHPFALSVTEEDASQYFDATDACRFMASIGRLKSSMPALQQFAFAGDRVRVHIVSREVNPRFWALLRKVGETAPAPLLVNTSFNLFGEPLVCSPREAVKSFYCAGIDALAIEDFLVVK
jgi:carbamoyltransferase